MDIHHFDARHCRSANLMISFDNEATPFNDRDYFRAIHRLLSSNTQVTPRLPNKLPKIEHSDSQTEIQKAKGCLRHLQLVLLYWIGRRRSKACFFLFLLVVCGDLCTVLQGFALTLSLTHNACFGAPSRWWYLAQPNQNAARWLQAMSTSDIMANQNDNALTMLDNGKNLFGIVWTLTCRWFLFTTFFAPRWKGMPAEAESLHRICLVVPLLALFWTQKHFRESTPRK